VPSTVNVPHCLHLILVDEPLHGYGTDDLMVRALQQFGGSTLAAKKVGGVS
jgi:hypothetical protein